MIIIKKFNEISNNIKATFFKLSDIDVRRFSVFDMFIKSISYVIEEVYKTIEENKKPYLFTKQKGDELDSTGYFLSCPRLDGETDENYFYRLSKWTQAHAACNQEAIKEVCRVLEYSTGYYVPYTKGVGTATIYLIPKTYEEDDKKRAITEAEEKFSKILSPSSIVEYSIPEPRKVKLVAYLDLVDNGEDEPEDMSSDIEVTKNKIIEDIKTYINGLAPGERLMVGSINRIGLKHDNVEYFNIIQTYINNKETSDFEIMQEIKTKFIFDEIIWWEVDK